jgi:hypothetical protein
MRSWALAIVPMLDHKRKKQTTEVQRRSLFIPRKFVLLLAFSREHRQSAGINGNESANAPTDRD